MNLQTDDRLEGHGHAGDAGWYRQRIGEVNASASRIDAGRSLHPRPRLAVPRASSTGRPRPGVAEACALRAGVRRRCSSCAHASIRATSRRREMVDERSSRSSRRYSARRLRPEHLGGRLLVAARAHERALDVIALDVDQQIAFRPTPRHERLRVRPTGRRRGRGRRCDRQADRQLALGDEVAVGQDARALDHVPQLAHVAVPRRRRQQPLGAGRQARAAASAAAREVSRTNAAVRYGMSSRRSRSGGSFTSTMFRR